MSDPNKALQAAIDRAERFVSCEQCGTCSSACPLTGYEDRFNIRRILRHLELGLGSELADSDLAWLCTTCGRCEAACPNGIGILDLVRPLRMLARDQRPAGPPPCVSACPAGIDIPGYLRFIAEGEPQKAYALIRQSVPFVGILGRVCPHPCETQCRRGLVNAPVAICALKRFAADQTTEQPAEATAVREATGKRVAIVGSGPAGLTAAFVLRQKGHAVTVYEANEKPGGMMRYGIPRYRLPAEILDAEINQILELGIELKTNTQLGRDVTLEGLRTEYNAVFIAVGLQRSKRIELQGSQLPGVHWGIEFLRQVASDNPPRVNPRVVVIGGGDVAIDVALTARRLGAEQVTLCCLERPEQMPAHPEEIAQALAEGVALRTSWGPTRILERDGHVSGIELQRCSAVFDAKGRFAPSFGDEQATLETDEVILAIGQTANISFDDGADQFSVNEHSGATTVDGVFAGGEIATGPGALIEAIASGKKIAAAIDRSLGGDGELPSWAAPPDSTAYDGKRASGFADVPPAELPTTDVSKRDNFCEVQRCLDAETARAEARRCLSCDLEADLTRLVKG